MTQIVCLVCRYTKLKEYYNTSDKKNIELSHALQQTNEILRQSQDQVAAKDERYKLLEQKKETELFARCLLEF